MSITSTIKVGGLKEMNKYIQTLAQSKGWSLPKRYPCTSVEQIEALVNSLPNLEEGVVLYNSQGVPVLKVKGKAYLAAHRMRGENGLNPKRCMDLVLMNEVDEYLTVFPEDVNKLAPYCKGWDDAMTQIYILWNTFALIEEQKEFALGVKDTIVAPLLFRMRNGKTKEEAIKSLTTNAKYHIITQYVNLDKSTI